MKFKEKDIIRILFLILIIIGFVVLIWKFDKSIVEGATNMNNGCNDCRIAPEYSPTSSNFHKVLTDANNAIAANHASGTGIGSGFLNNYFGSAMQGNNCVNLDLHNVTDGSYVFCPWQPGDKSSSTDCCNNTVFGLSTYNTSYCCSNSTFYNDNYLLVNDTSMIHGLTFKVGDLPTNTYTNDMGVEISQKLYSFEYPSSILYPNTYTISGFDISVNIHQPNHTTDNYPINQSVFGTDNDTVKTDKYVNCQGDLCNNTWSDFGSTNCLDVPQQYVSNNQWCWNQSNKDDVCDMSNVGDPSCNKLWLPKPGKGPGQSGSGDVASPSGGIDIDGVSQSMQTAIDQLVNKFTTQINSLTTSIGDSLQFPNLGSTQYLNIGSCNNNAPYVYNSGCDTSLGNLSPYTCYPSMTGAFSDCGPPGYDAKPHF